MNKEIASSLISGGASAVNSAGNIISQLLANHQNEKLAEKQNQWNLQQWQRENEYNTPANQVARLKEAGINPDMYYGQNGLMNESAPSPTIERATMYPFQADFDLGSAVQSYWQSQIAQAQVKNMNADVALKEQQISESKQGVLESQSRINKMKQDMAESVDRCRKIASEIKNLDEDTKKTVRERIHIAWTEMNGDRQFKMYEKDVYSQMRLRTKEGQLIDAKKAFTYQQFNEAVALLPYKLVDMQETISNKKVERLSNSLAYNINLEMGAIGIQKGRKELQGLIYDVNRKGQYYNLDFGSGLGNFMHLFLHASDETVKAVSPFAK